MAAISATPSYNNFIQLDFKKGIKERTTVRFIYNDVGYLFFQIKRYISSSKASRLKIIFYNDQRKNIRLKPIGINIGGKNLHDKIVEDGAEKVFEEISIIAQQQKYIFKSSILSFPININLRL